MHRTKPSVWQRLEILTGELAADRTLDNLPPVLQGGRVSPAEQAALRSSQARFDRRMKRLGTLLEEAGKPWKRP